MVYRRIQALDRAGRAADHSVAETLRRANAPQAAQDGKGPTKLRVHARLPSAQDARADRGATTRRPRGHGARCDPTLHGSSAPVARRAETVASPLTRGIASPQGLAMDRTAGSKRRRSLGPRGLRGGSGAARWARPGCGVWDPATRCGGSGCGVCQRARPWVGRSYGVGHATGVVAVRTTGLGRAQRVAAVATTVLSPAQRVVAFATTVLTSGRTFGIGTTA